MKFFYTIIIFIGLNIWEIVSYPFKLIYSGFLKPVFGTLFKFAKESPIKFVLFCMFLYGWYDVTISLHEMNPNDNVVALFAYGLVTMVIKAGVLTGIFYFLKFMWHDYLSHWIKSNWKKANQITGRM